MLKTYLRNIPIMVMKYSKKFQMILKTYYVISDDSEDILKKDTLEDISIEGKDTIGKV